MRFTEFKEELKNHMVPPEDILGKEIEGEDFTKSGGTTSYKTYMPRLVLRQSIVDKLASMGIVKGSKEYIGFQEDFAQRKISGANTDKDGNIDMGDAQFEQPTPAQTRALYRSIMGSAFGKPQEVEALYAIVPNLKKAVAQSGKTPPNLKFATKSGFDSFWKDTGKTVEQGAKEFVQRGDAGKLGGSTQKEYDRMKKDGYVFNKYGEWQWPAEDDEGTASKYVGQKTDPKAKGYLPGGYRQTAHVVGGKEQPGGHDFRGVASDAGVAAASPEWQKRQDDKFNKVFGLDKMKWSQPNKYGTRTMTSGGEYNPDAADDDDKEPVAQPAGTKGNIKVKKS